jgi:Carboxypeptidase regulatory-like domain
MREWTLHREVFVNRLCATFLLTAWAGTCAACGDLANSPSSIAASPGNATVGFNGLSIDDASVTTYTESGFKVSATSGDWSVRTTYGHPAPLIQFWAPGGSTVTGEIQVGAAAAAFYFKSVDLYSSTTPIPYTIKGLRNSSIVFTVTDSLPNTFGDFRTVANPNSGDAIDTLSIVLTNSAAPCCRNPMGLDNIVLTSAPTTTTPTMFSLSGQVTDSGTGIGIAGARVSIADGPNAHVVTSTDAAGNYRFTGLQQSGFTVDVSASNYMSQSQGVTLTSNQTLSFQLTRQPSIPTPAGVTVIGFDALTADGASITTYTQSGFTVSATSDVWLASLTYGHPAPFIQFSAPGGSTVTGEVRVSAGGAAFGFRSVDLYSSTTPIPYTITGLRNSSTVFTLADTLPNTFGNFRTIVNPNAAALVNGLSIVLTNAAAPCCRNPMGLDTIVLAQ